MNRIGGKSIKRRITLITVFISSFVLILAGVALFILQAWSLRQNYLRQLEATTKITARNLSAAVIFNDEDRADYTLSALRAMPEIQSAAIILKNGRLLATYGNTLSVDAQSVEKLTKQPEIRGNWIALARHIERDGQIHGILYLGADFSAPYSKLLKLHLSILSVILAASLLFAFFLSRYFQGLVSTPILNLAGVAHKIADAKDYSVRAISEGDDEVRVLTTAFNQMLGQIEEQDQKLHKTQAELREKLTSLNLEIVERIRAESEQRKLTAIINNTPDFIGTIDPLGRVLYLNAAARTMLGLKTDFNVSELSVIKLHTPTAARIVSTEAIPTAIHSGSWSGETTILNANGDEIHVSEVIIAHKNPNGGLEQLSMVLRDITERRTSEEALRAAELKFRGFVEQLPSITYHAGIGERCDWTYISPQVQPLLGFTPEEWMQSDTLWLQQVHPEDKQIAIDAEITARKTGTYTAEYRMFTKSGELRWFKDLALFVPQKGKTPESFLGSLIDITNSKLNDERLAELNTKLLESSRMAGMAEIATGVLHNVGNVLNSVNVSAGIVLDKLRRSKADKVAKAAELLNNHSQDLAAYLTHDSNGKKLPGYLAKLGIYLANENSELLAEVNQLSHNIEHIKQVVAMQQSYAKVSGVFEDLKLDLLIEDALAMNIGAFERHGITIEKRFLHSPTVRVDRHRVLQILINLIRNAKHAIDDAKREDKRIIITVAPVNESLVRVSVIDNGIGIAPENLNKIFGHGFTTRKDGHGFGLHSGANSAREMGGALSAQSQGIGHGATFTLDLPITKNSSKS